jgi:hypothetical protein
MDDVMAFLGFWGLMVFLAARIRRAQHAQKVQDLALFQSRQGMLGSKKFLDR